MDLGIQELIDTMLPILNERQRRLFLAKQAAILGYGGITEISNYTGVSRQTITNGTYDIFKNAWFVNVGLSIGCFRLSARTGEGNR
jgi:hypothetical protein